MYSSRSNNMGESFRQFLKQPITKGFVEVLVAKVERMVAGPQGRSPLPPPTPGLAQHNLPPLSVFAHNLIMRSRVQPATLFGAMVYLDRLRDCFKSLVASHRCAGHRILLAAMVVAGKFLNDSSPKNRHWASYSLLFKVNEVSLMEREFLYHLKFNLTVAMDQLLVQYQLFAHINHLPPTPQSGTFSSPPPLVVVPSNVSYPSPPMLLLPQTSSSTSSLKSTNRNLYQRRRTNQKPIHHPYAAAPAPSSSHPPRAMAWLNFQLSLTLPPLRLPPITTCPSQTL